MDLRALDELRLLTNPGEGPAAPVVLLGQPELAARVARVPQLDQRVVVRYHLGPMIEAVPDENVTEPIVALTRSPVVPLNVSRMFWPGTVVEAVTLGPPGAKPTAASPLPPVHALQLEELLEADLPPFPPVSRLPVAAEGRVEVRVRVEADPAGVLDLSRSTGS